MKRSVVKKMVCLFMALTIASFSVTACNEIEDTDDTGDPAATETTPSAETSATEESLPTGNTAPGPIINPTTLPEDVESDVEHAHCEITGYSNYNGEFSDMFLKPGDRVSVIAPSSLPSQEQFDATVEGLTSWGYIPVPGNNVLKADRTLKDCREDFLTALKDSSTKAIFCIRGGYGSSEVMDDLGEEVITAIKNSRKLIIGFSDITIYHSAWTVAGLPSVHAMMSGSFMTLSNHCAEVENNVLQGKIPSYRCETNGYCKQGSAEGVLIGGNLSTMTAVMNTVYDCTKAGKPYILFIEEVGEDILHIHRSLEILKHAGVLDRAEAVVFGEWKDIPADFGGYGGDSRGGEFRSVEDMISREFLKEYNKPVAFGFPAGHSNIVNYPLLMGQKSALNVSGSDYTLMWN